MSKDVVGLMKVSIRGVSPLLLNNGHTADPLNPYTKKMKPLQAKRKKTDDDYEKIARLEWESSLYLDEEGMLILPSECIEAMMREAAGKSRLIVRKDLDAGAWVDSDAVIKTDAPFPNLDAVYKAGYVSRKLVRVNSSRVVRTRPIFFSWSLKFEVSYLTELINKADLEKVVEVASYRIGIGDWRPKFGRFEIVSVE